MFVLSSFPTLPPVRCKQLAWNQSQMQSDYTGFGPNSAQDNAVYILAHGVRGRNVRGTVVDVYQSSSSASLSTVPIGRLPSRSPRNVCFVLSGSSLTALLPPPQSNHPDGAIHDAIFLLAPARGHLLVLCPRYALIFPCLFAWLIPKSTSYRLPNFPRVQC